MLLSIIVPAYNEEKLLPGFLKEVTAYLKKANPDYELIVVENGSQDRTLEIARIFAKKDKRIRVEHLSRPAYGKALIGGIKQARGDYVAIFNIDFWDERFIDIVKEDLLGYDIITGSKNLPESCDKRPLSRRLVTKGFNLFLRIFFRYKGTDTHGIKVLRRNIVMPIVKKCRTKTGIFDSEFLVRAQRVGLKILELPVEITEKRPNRFGIKRILETPGDIWNLCQALKRKGVKFPGIFRKSFDFRLILLILTIILFIPATGIKFSWVDDGYNLLTAQNYLKSIKTLDISRLVGLVLEERIGRFRPAYWLWLISSYLIGGNNPTIHYLLHFILIFATSFLIFKTVFLITKSKWASLFSGSLFLINPINTENWYRLGPQEPIVGFFSILSVYILIKQKYKWLPIVFLGFAFLSKESACALLPAVIVLYLGKRLFLKKRDLMLEKYSVASLIFFGIMILITSLTRSGYSEFYVFNLREMLHRFLFYIKISWENLEPFFGVLVLVFLLRIIFLFKRLKFKLFDKITLLEIFFGFWYVSFLAVQSPWKYIMTRYMLPAIVGLVVFMGIELSQLSVILKKQKIFLYKTIVFIFSGSLVLFLTVNLVGIVNYGRRSAHSTIHVQKMIKYLAENAPQNSNVFLNFAKGEGTIELVIETRYHLELFYSRPDLKVDYLDISNFPQEPYFIVSGSSAPLGYPEQLVEKQPMVKLLTEIKSYGEIPVITTSANLLKQILKKSTRLVLYKEKFDLEGIYTPYYLRDYWKIYYVKS